MECSLWLTPPDQTPAERFLWHAIRDIRKANEIKQCPPSPHVTLVGGIEGDKVSLCEKTGRIAASLTPYEIRFEGIRWSASYFRNLFLEVMRSQRVMDAYTAAQKILGTDQRQYAPHCSLVYGELREEETKSLRTTLIEKGALKIIFPVASIELWQTDGPTQEWRLVKAFPFSGA